MPALICVSVAFRRGVWQLGCDAPRDKEGAGPRLPRGGRDRRSAPLHPRAGAFVRSVAPRDPSTPPPENKQNDQQTGLEEI